MIYINAVRQLIDPIDKSKQRPIFDIRFIKLSTGSIVSGRVVCTSTNWQRDMVNFKFISSGEQRSIHALQMIEINGEEIMV